MASELGGAFIRNIAEVPWREFFATLKQVNFHGNCCIEREAGNQRVQDIRAAREFVEKLK